VAPGNYVDVYLNLNPTVDGRKAASPVTLRRLTRRRKGAMGASRRGTFERGPFVSRTWSSAPRLSVASTITTTSGVQVQVQVQVNIDVNVNVTVGGP
jgi:hypothetical protein